MISAWDIVYGYGVVGMILGSLSIALAIWMFWLNWRTNKIIDERKKAKKENTP